MQSYSQWKEDIILSDIFKQIGTTNKLCVEIGAWDGVHFSNTKLFRDNGWSAILAESNEERLASLYDTARREPDTKAFGHVVSIDAMLDFFEAPAEPDLLSIDVDGDDYYLWEDMTKYRPRVVVIEYNQTVPPGFDIKQQRGGSFGASMNALVDLGESKGYTLIRTTATNLIFVRNELVYKIPVDEIIYSTASKWLQYIVTGYNGKQYLIGEPAHKDNQDGMHEQLISNIEIRPL